MHIYNVYLLYQFIYVSHIYVLLIIYHLREGVENESEEQVCFADKILLNKIDLADEAKLKKIEAALRKLNPTTPILRCEHGKFYRLELVVIVVGID